MADVVLPYTLTNGNPADADEVMANFDEIVTAVNDLDAVVAPQARVHSTLAIAIADSTLTALPFNSERWDIGTATEQHSNTVNPSRLTCKVAGLYHIGASLRWMAAGGGRRDATFYLNGTTPIATVDDVPQSYHAVVLSADYRLAVNDYVEVKVYHTQGGTPTIELQANASPEFWWHRVSA